MTGCRSLPAESSTSSSPRTWSPITRRTSGNSKRRRTRTTRPEAFERDATHAAQASDSAQSRWGRPRPENAEQRSTSHVRLQLTRLSHRPAKVGDKLVTTQFLGTVTRGLAAVAEPQTAVCMPPGTEVAFDQDVKYAHPLLWFRNCTIKERVAKIRQVNTDNSQTHHDALEFPSGRLMLVNRTGGAPAAHRAPAAGDRAACSRGGRGEPGARRSEIASSPLSPHSAHAAEHGGRRGDRRGPVWRACYAAAPAIAMASPQPNRH